MRRVELAQDDAFDVTLVEPPCNAADGDSTRACVYVWLRTPTLEDLLVLPRGLGPMCFGPEFIATRPPKKTWNAIGLASRLGEDDAPGPTPLIPDGGAFELLSFPTGFGRPLRATFQGFVEDSCSSATVPFSVTNAVIVEVQ